VILDSACNEIFPSFIWVLRSVANPENIRITLTPLAFTGGAFELVGLLSLVSREHLRQQQSELPRRPLDETGKTAREDCHAHF